MKILLFQREYEAKRNPEPRSDYPFSRSKEDTLQQDMYQICMKISSSDFLWQEPNKTITILSFQEIGTIATPSYKVPIC